jgi:hypothetical protein
LFTLFCPSLVDTYDFDCLDTSALAIAGEFQLRISHHAENGDNYASHITRRGDLRFKNTQRGPLGVYFMKEVQHIWR